MAGGRCERCGAPYAAAGDAATILPASTPAPPSGATPGPTLGPTSDPASGATIGSLPTLDPASGQAAAAPARPADGGPLRIGQSFGPRYHIIDLLGVGGMGAVYRAWDQELGVAVALKLVRADAGRHADVEKRFKQELLLARQVTHKHVVRIHDLGEIDGIKYITMPYVQGADLATVLKAEGKQPVARTMRIARQIADGLRAAHEAGVVHRDLKPANVMISTVDGDVQALIMDFGISASARESASGEIVGTLEYMAPEQGTGVAVDGRADIYAFGLIVYEMLVGPRPVEGTTSRERIEAMQRRIADGLPPLRQIDDTIPAPLEKIVMRCLERDPAARFATTADLVGALAELDDAGEKIPIARRITKRLTAAIVVLVLGLLVGTYFVTRQAVLPPAQHDPVSVLIADLQNNTGDPAFDRTLEPMLKRALEGSAFITAYDRDGLRGLGVPARDQLDAVAAREVAVKQGLGVVLSGSLASQGRGYRISMQAAQAVTGTVMASAQGTASGRNDVLQVATRLIARIRGGLGDDTSESAQQFAMASVSASSLDVVRLYAAAMEAQSRNRFDDARQNALKAVQLDPNFGIGYLILATASRNLGRDEDDQRYIKEALAHLDGMTERERFQTRGYADLVNGDYQQCVKEYSDLIARYPSDVGGHNQLALCFTQLRQMRRAAEEMQAVVKILPSQPLFRDNLALYADYGSDFRTAEQEARKVGSQDTYATLALAFAQLGQGQLTAVRETYARLRGMGTTGASIAASGEADLAALQGRFSDAASLLTQGATADVGANNPDAAAAKLAALAYTELSRGRSRAAIAAAKEALKHSSAVKIRFLAARTLVEAGDTADARPLADSLGRELYAEPQAYAKLIEGDIALKTGDAPRAMSLLRDANNAFDTWIGLFDLGRASLAAGALVQADSAFDVCLNTRRGEALALFVDEEPTFAYLAPVYYYAGRVREALKNARYRESYDGYLKLRDGSTEDPLLPEVHRRAAG